VSRNLGFRLVLSDEDSARLREILATQEVSLAKPPIWDRVRFIFVFLVLITLLGGSVMVLWQTEFVREAVSDLIEAVVKSWGQFQDRIFRH